MKLLYIARARIPTEKAHGIQIMKMCEAFSNIGLNVELLIPPRVQPEKLKNRDPYEYYGIEENFKIKKLSVPDLIFLIKFFPKRFAPVFFHLHDMIFSLSSLVYTILKSPDIIFTRDAKVAFFLSFFKPVIYEAHGFPHESRIQLFFEKKAFEKSKVFITTSKQLKEKYVKNGFDRTINVSPHGVSIDKFDIGFSREEARESLSLPLKEKLVIYIGHLYGWKGVYTLVSAPKFDDKVILVGGLKEDIDEMNSYLYENKIDNVVLVGHVRHEYIPLYLKAADVLVLPLQAMGVEKGSTPLKLFEYMASKRPIVASDLPSIREVLNEGNAVLVEPDSPRALSEGINMVLEDRELARKVAEKAYYDVKRYTWENRAEEIVKMVEVE